MTRICVLAGLISLLISPTLSQFGVASKKRKGATFEEANELAKEQYGIDVDALGKVGLGGSLDDLTGMYERLMKEIQNQDLAKALEQADPQELEAAMEELRNLTPEKLAAQMQEAMKLLSSEDVMSSLMNNQEELLRSLQGMVPSETLEEYRRDPSKLQAGMKEAMEQMQHLFSDPESLKTITDIASQVASIMTQPEKLLEALSSVSSGLYKDLQDDQKIEEARLQLLNDPNMAGNPVLAGVYNTPEMKQILNDPVKWRETVKRGQGMLLGREGAAAI